MLSPPNAVDQELDRAHHPVEVLQFDAAQRVPHDFIDPHQPDQQIAISYPKLIELLEK